MLGQGQSEATEQGEGAAHAAIAAEGAGEPEGEGAFSEGSANPPAIFCYSADMPATD